MALYLDHNASTPVNEQVLEAMLPYLKNNFGNPSSTHSFGREAASAMEIAREQVAELVGSLPGEVIFTSGGTEANNLAVKGSAFNAFAISSIEHPSISAPAKQLSESGKQLFSIAVNSHGKLELDDLEQKLKLGAEWISVMWANNETGVVQNMGQVYDICQYYGTRLHSDAVQIAGRIPVHFGKSLLDMLSLSSHKIYGPKGAGALVVKKDIKLNPLLSGGAQEKNKRSGTENVAAIVGFGKAAQIAREQLDISASQQKLLRDHFEFELKKRLPEVNFFSQGVERLPNTSMITIPEYDGQTLVMAMDKLSIAISSGSACGSTRKEPSKVLAAMGVKPELANGAIRVSFGRNNCIEDVNYIVDALVNQVSQFKKMNVLSW